MDAARQDRLGRTDLPLDRLLQGQAVDVRRPGLRGPDVPRTTSGRRRTASTWTKVGTAAWPPRGGQTMVVYHDRLWLFGGANHVAPDRSTDGFLNDVWVSDDGVDVDAGDRAAPVVASRLRRAWSSSTTSCTSSVGRATPTCGARRTARTGRSSTARRRGSRGTAPPRLVFDGSCGCSAAGSATSTNALNDVWYSDDGVTWNRQAEHAPVGARGPGRHRLPGQDLDLQRQAHRRRRQLGRRPLADDRHTFLVRRPVIPHRISALVRITTNAATTVAPTTTTWPAMRIARREAAAPSRP